jgi:hypothetical protein
VVALAFVVALAAGFFVVVAFFMGGSFRYQIGTAPTFARFVERLQVNS